MYNLNITRKQCSDVHRIGTKSHSTASYIWMSRVTNTFYTNNRSLIPLFTDYSLAQLNILIEFCFMTFCKPSIYYTWWIFAFRYRSPCHSMSSIPAYYCYKQILGWPSERVFVFHWEHKAYSRGQLKGTTYTGMRSVQWIGMAVWCPYAMVQHNGLQWQLRCV